MDKTVNYILNDLKIVVYVHDINREIILPFRIICKYTF